jgi:hypothetical protein
MITKELSIVQGVQPDFIESMYAEVVHEALHGGLLGVKSFVDSCDFFLISQICHVPAARDSV